MGLSIRPPPATTPSTHRAELVRQSTDVKLTVATRACELQTTLSLQSRPQWERGNRVKASYQLLLCWLRRWLSWSLRAAWLWSSWSRGCGRWLWRSFPKRGPVCLCHQVSPPRSRWWFPQALCQRAERYRCSAELWDKDEGTETLMSLQELLCYSDNTVSLVLIPLNNQVKCKVQQQLVTFFWVWLIVWSMKKSITVQHRLLLYRHVPYTF